MMQLTLEAEETIIIIIIHHSAMTVVLYSGTTGADIRPNDHYSVRIGCPIDSLFNSTIWISWLAFFEEYQTACVHVKHQQ